MNYVIIGRTLLGTIGFSNQTMHASDREIYDCLVIVSNVLKSHDSDVEVTVADFITDGSTKMYHNAVMNDDDAAEEYEYIYTKEVMDEPVKIEKKLKDSSEEESRAGMSMNGIVELKNS